MSCCSPEYRKVVEEQEKKINEKGRDSLPLFGKMIAVLICAGALLVGYFLF